MASFSFGNSLSPYSKYTVYGIGDYARFITQPEPGTNSYEKVVNSMFLGVKTSQNGLSDAPIILILKPKNLWLKVDSSSIKDVYSNDASTIVNYSPEYTHDKQISINYLPYPIAISDIFSGVLTDSNDISKAQNIINVLLGSGAQFIFAEDVNKENRTRIAAPNLPPSNYDSFSRWL